jgi:hypothetical protein
MHAKYEVSTCIISKVMANVKVGHKQRDIQTNRQTNKPTDRQTNKQTGQKQYAPPPFSGWGHKNVKKCSDKFISQVIKTKITGAQVHMMTNKYTKF